jgi:hypothetical protein
VCDDQLLIEICNSSQEPYAYPIAINQPVRVLTLLSFSAQASAQGQLSVSPTSISAQANVGASVPSQTVNISNSGNGSLKWSISTPTASWLSVSPTSGTGANKSQ